MPRRRRIAKPRRGSIATLTPTQRKYLNSPLRRFTWDGREPITDGREVLFATVADLDAALELHGESLIAEYQQTHNGEKPYWARLKEETSGDADDSPDPDDDDEDDAEDPDPDDDALWENGR